MYPIVFQWLRLFLEIRISTYVRSPPRSTIQRTLFINFFHIINQQPLRGEPFVDDMAAGHRLGDLRNNMFPVTVAVAWRQSSQGRGIIPWQRTHNYKAGVHNNTTTMVISTCAIFKRTAYNFIRKIRILRTRYGCMYTYVLVSRAHKWSSMLV